MSIPGLTTIQSEEEFIALLRARGFYRDDDVTFEDLGEFGMAVFAGDELARHVESLDGLEIGALLVEGSLAMDRLDVSAIIGDFGVLCVTGDVRCRDLLYMTESTSLCVGGDLEIEHIYYGDCGNSALYVAGALRAQLFYNYNCEVEIVGEEHIAHEDEVSPAELEALGVSVASGEDPDDALRRYFQTA